MAVPSRLEAGRKHYDGCLCLIDLIFFFFFTRHKKKETQLHIFTFPFFSPSSFLLPPFSHPPTSSIINHFYPCQQHQPRQKNMNRDSGSKRRLASLTLFTTLMVVLTSTGSTFIAAAAQGNVPDIDPGTVQDTVLCCSRPPLFFILHLSFFLLFWQCRYPPCFLTSSCCSLNFFFF